MNYGPTPTRRQSACFPPSLCGATVATRIAPIKPKTTINHGKSLIPSPPAALLIRLPISDFKATRFAVGPGSSRPCNGVGVVAVENHYHPLIAGRVRGQGGVIDQEPDIGLIRVALFHRKHDRLVSRVAGSPCGMRQERIVPIGPQMTV